MIQTFHNFTLFRLSSFFKGFNGSTGNIDNNTVVIQKSCISPAGVSWRARNDDGNNACAAHGRDYRFVGVVTATATRKGWTSQRPSGSPASICTVLSGAVCAGWRHGAEFTPMRVRIGSRRVREHERASDRASEQAVRWRREKTVSCRGPDLSLTSGRTSRSPWCHPLFLVPQNAPSAYLDARLTRASARRIAAVSRSTYTLYQ